MKALAPSTTERVSEAMRAGVPMRVVGSGTKAGFRLGLGAALPELRVCMSGIVEFTPEDQVVVVQAGTPVAELQSELAKHGQTLPLPPEPLLAGFPGTVAGSLSMNLPHALQAQCGSWRDWVLGLTLVRADGAVARTGSKAVKNVAGYDAHKLLIGARGSLGVITEVILRTFPLRSLPSCDASLLREPAGPLWIQRTLRIDFGAAVSAAESDLIAADPASCTLWRGVSLEDPPRFAHDWYMRTSPAGLAGEGLDVGLMRRTKGILDPDGLLNPGEWGE